MDAADLEDLQRYLTPEELAELDAILAADIQDTPWRPLPGPQTMAYESEADVIGYGGAAGGGKTDLGCGMALMQHRRVAMFRREAPQLVGIIDRLTDMLGSRNGYNGQEKVWRHAGPRDVNIEFGSTPNTGDEKKHQGRPKDLLLLDEATNFLESQARFLMGWVRSTVQGQRCQTLMTFNPPTDAEGRWVVAFFAPWLDDMHPLYPAEAGQLLWVATIQGRDDWSRPDDARPFVVDEDGQRIYEFRRQDFAPTEIITPQSRTFIPSRVTDNPFLMGTGYMTTLQALPEPLRSQMLNGDFKAGMEDSEWQAIPTSWVDAAMGRWKPLAGAEKPAMDSLGVDVARGGADKTVRVARHGTWYDKPLRSPGKDTPDGPSVAGLAIAAVRDSAVIHIDVIGVGASPYDFLMEAHQDVIGVNVAEKSAAMDRSGRLGFFNLRSQLVWQFREALDPKNDTGIALFPDQQTRADLCAFTWKLKGDDIYVESREEVVKRLGRSPDDASALFLASMDTPKRRDVKRQMDLAQGRRPGDYDPLSLPGVRPNQGDSYDPLAFNR